MSDHDGVEQVIKIAWRAHAAKVATVDRTPTEAARARALLTRALDSPAVRELLTTPLQAHIMAVLVRNGQRPPERKWDLYHKFYEVIREREANRDLPDSTLRELFQGDPGLIDAVHQRLGFALHTRAETASGADASLTKAEFRVLVEGVVHEARRASEVGPVVEALLRATTERLVLINTPDQGDRVRFDIRAIQEFFAAEYLYVDTPADNLRERLELVAGDPHWREVVQFVLGALTSLKRATEWTVALDVLRALDSGDGVDSALARRLARGALHAAVFLDNGAAEHSRKVRDQLRPVLDPVACTRDETLLGVMARISTPESRAWVVSWAQEEVRRLQPLDSCGALRVLAALWTPELEHAEPILTLLDGLETRQVDDLLRGLRRERGPAREARERDQWQLEAERRLLQRDDCVSQATEVVGRVLWEAAWPHSGRPSSHRRSPRGTFFPGSQPGVLDLVAQMYGDSTVRRFGGVELCTIHSAPDSNKLIGASEHGLLQWLGLLHEVRAHGGVARTREALLCLGDDWTVTRYLPVELRNALPIPADERVTPQAIAATIQGMSDTELQQCLAGRTLGSIPLRTSDTELLMFSDTPLNLQDWLSLIGEDAGAALMVWCFGWTDSNRGAARSSRWEDGLKGPGAMSSVRRALVDAIERQPWLVLRISGPTLIPGLAALGRQQSRALSAFRTSDLRWKLRFWERSDSGSLVPLVLDLPDDTRLLPLVAAHRISTALTAVRHGGRLRTTTNEASQGWGWESPAALEEVFESTAHTLDERAAALLLLGLPQKAGWPRLCRERSELLRFAQHGIPVAAGVAVAAELAGLSSDPEARRLISELIGDTRAARMREKNHISHERVMDALTQVWRERSNAPLTATNATSRWLGLSVT